MYSGKPGPDEDFCGMIRVVSFSAPLKKGALTGGHPRGRGSWAPRAAAPDAHLHALHQICIIVWEHHSQHYLETASSKNAHMKTWTYTCTHILHGFSVQARHFGPQSEIQAHFQSQTAQHNWRRTVVLVAAGKEDELQRVASCFQLFDQVAQP